MRPHKLDDLFKGDRPESYPEGSVFHSLDFDEKLYLIEGGYVKRFSVNQEKNKVIESIYGPSYLFPLTPVFSKILGLKLSKEHSTYIYQTMSKAEIRNISLDSLVKALKETPEIYADLLYESGRRLRANINRLASNALKDDDKKIALQLVYLADEFGKADRNGTKVGVKILAPLKPIDIAEQLNISVDTVELTLKKLQKQQLISMSGSSIALPDVDMLKDVYL